MTSDGSFFRTKWYHLCMALLYIGAGVVLILQGDDETKMLQPSYLGWLLVIYGAWRLLSRWLLKR